MRELKIDLADGRYAVIRNFLKNRDRSKIRKAAFANKNYSAGELQQGMEIEVSGEALIGMQEVQIETLLMDYNGERETPFEALMDSEFEDDFNKITEAVGAVFAEADKNLEK